MTATAARTLVAAFAAAFTLVAISLHGASASVSGTSIAPDFVVTDEHTMVTFDPLDNDSADFLRGSVSVATTPLHGTATATSNGLLRYLGEPGFNGEDFFSYSACTAGGACATATVTVEVMLLGPYRVVFSRNGLVRSVAASGGGESQVGSPLPAVGDWPTYSPDGSKLATLPGNVIRVTDRDAGNEQLLLGATNAISSHLSWSPNGQQLVFGNQFDELWRGALTSTGVSGGPLEQVVEEYPGVPGLVPVHGRRPSFAGTAIVFDTHQPPENVPDPTDLGISALAGTAVTRLVPPVAQDADGRSDGSLVYVTAELDRCPAGGVLWSLVVKRDLPRTILSRCGTQNAPYNAPRFSPDGTKIVFDSSSVPFNGDGNTIFIVNADGSNLQPLVDRSTYDAEPSAGHPNWDTQPTTYPLPAWAHGGRLLATTGTSGNCCPTGSIRRLAPNGSGTTDFLADTHGAFKPDTQQGPQWSPDGKKLVFAAADPSFMNLPGLFVENADGTGLTKLTNVGPRILNWGAFSDPTWSPDGTQIAVVVQPFNTSTFQLEAFRELWILNADGTNLHRVLRCTGFQDCSQPDWSPDGTWIVYQRGSGLGLSLVKPDGTGNTDFVGGSNLDESPAWSPDGTKLAFVRAGRLMVADFVAPPAGLAQPRFVGPLTTGQDEQPTWSPDGGAIAFIHGYPDRALWVARADGTGNTRISGYDGVTLTNPDWGPGDPVPTLQSLSPISGPSAGGTTVTLTGAHFQGPATAVTFGDAPASVTGGSPTSLTVSTPPHAPGPVDVVVTNPDGQSATLQAAFTYDDSMSITSVQPSSGPAAGGDTVTITGTNLGGPGAEVTFGGDLATVTGGSTTTLTVRTPAHAPGPVDVAVRGPGGGTALLEHAYTYLTELRIDSVSPSIGPQIGGNQAVVQGGGFDAGVHVAFGGVPAIVTSATPTSLTVIVPPHDPGLADVVVTNADSRSVTLPQGYTYFGLPFIAGVSPGSGPAAGGTLVTVSGHDLGGPTARVFFGGIEAEVTGGSDVTLTVRTPAHAASVVDVEVTTPAGSVTSFAAYTYVAKPTITSVQPNEGVTAGGDLVTIAGSGFLSGATVDFDGVRATLRTVSPTTLTVVTPPHAAGSVAVHVTNPDGQAAVLSAAFMYVAHAVSMQPSGGPPGTPVTVTGSGFEPGERVDVEWEPLLGDRKTEKICKATALPDGTFSCTGEVPRVKKAGPPGAHRVFATGARSDADAMTLFGLTP